jgi:hypothetical protein
VTPVRDIEIEVVFRIAVRGRTRDLARLFEALNKSESLVLAVVEKRTASEEQSQKDVMTIAGGLSG